MQTLDYALLVVDRDKRIVWANSGAAWILAATIAEIVGREVTAFFTPGDIAFGIPEHELSSALRQGSSDDDRWMLRADGSAFWASGKTVSLTQRDGTPMGFFKIFRDETEFRMRVDGLQQQAAGAPPAAATHPLLSLEEELQAAITLATGRADPGGRTLELLLPPGAPITLQGDRAALQQAFALLVQNAVASTADAGRIWINGTTDGDQAVVHVEDNGRGIDAAGLATLFEVFTQPLPEERGPETGLARVRRIVEAHHGTIQARSEGAGKGSEFVVRLPLRQPGRATPAR